jgi:hypothetical protein
MVGKHQGRGAHEIWWNPGTKVRLIVDTRSKITANEILRDAGFPKAF